MGHWGFATLGVWENVNIGTLRGCDIRKLDWGTGTLGHWEIGKMNTGDYGWDTGNLELGNWEAARLEHWEIGRPGNWEH